MKKNFIVNIAILVLANLLIKPFYLFGIERQIQMIVGNVDYGRYYNIFNFTLILQIINDFGIQNYTNRLISQNREDSKNLVRSLLGFKVISSLTYLVITIFISYIWYGKELDLGFVLHLSFNQILISLIFFLRSNVSGLGFYKTDTFLSILDRLLLIFMMGTIIYVPMLRDYIQISVFVWVQTISLLLCVIICASILMRHHYIFSGIRIDKNETLKILKTCLPFALIYLTSSLFMKSESIWLEKILPNGNEEVGIYASCFRIYDALSIVSLSFGSLLLAMFARAQYDKEQLKHLLGTAILILWVIALFCGYTGYFYGIEINQLLNHNEDHYSISILNFLLLAFIPGSINYILGAYYQATHREIQLYKIYGLIAILSISLNVILIHSYKALGSSVSFLISQTFLLIVSTIVIRSEIKDAIDYKFNLAIYSLTLFGFFYFIRNQFHFHYLIEIGILGILSLLLLFPTQLVDKKIIASIKIGDLNK